MSNLEDGFGGLFAERETGVANVSVQGGLAAEGMHGGEDFGHFQQRCGLGLGAVLGDLDRLLGHFESLFGIRLRLADGGGHLVLGGVDGGEGLIDVGGRINARDEGGVELDAIAGGGFSAGLLHVAVDEGEIAAEVVDGDALDGALGALAVEGGDAVAEGGDKKANDMRGGELDTEEVGVEISFARFPADLAGNLDGEVVLRDGVDEVLFDIGVPGDVHGLDGHVDFADALPGPFEVGATREDDSNVRVVVAPPFLRCQKRSELGILRGGSGHALGAAERGEDAALGWADGIHTKQEREQRGDADSDEEARDDGDHG